MKNIFIEGIQGSGKSTLIQRLSEALPEYHRYAEGDISPVELAWCTYMTEPQYQETLAKYPDIQEEIRKWTAVEGERYIVAYTRIITDYPGFHKDLEQYEIYNGRRSLEELKEIVLRRYEAFHGQGNLFECAFFQNIVEDMILFHLLSDDEIVAFYKELWEKVDKERFLMLYLDNEDIAENVRIIREERCDQQGNQLWYQLMVEYLKSCPYAKEHDLKDFEGMVAHFEHRRAVEKRIIKEVLEEHAVILTAKKYDIEEILEYLA
ncbi:MAG: hypothetical protein IJZ82_06725 [Lachnospiraceae bacterium]|nr:hypothetical protein [Lachnospiraceae bacterium]